jgi:hypothetical protein
LGLFQREIVFADQARPVKVFSDLKALRDLSIKLSHSNELGELAQRKRGQGTDFSALREYAIGDDSKAVPAIQERLLASEIWKGIEWVGLYSAVKNEVETRLLFMKALEAGLSVYFPRVEQGIRFYAVEELEDLQKGAGGILEPRHQCPLMDEVPPNGLVAVPGVVFDQQ